MFILRAYGLFQSDLSSLHSRMSHHPYNTIIWRIYVTVSLMTDTTIHVFHNQHTKPLKLKAFRLNIIAIHQEGWAFVATHRWKSQKVHISQILVLEVRSKGSLDHEKPEYIFLPLGECFVIGFTSLSICMSMQMKADLLMDDDWCSLSIILRHIVLLFVRLIHGILNTHQ